MNADRNTPRNILLVSASLEGGGAERQLVQMANYWAAQGVRVTLATWSGRDVADFYRVSDGVRRVHLDTEDTGTPLRALRTSWRRVARLRALLRVERPDALVSFITQNNVLAISAAAGLPLRVVVSERADPAHDVTVRRGWRLLSRLVYLRADLVVAQTYRVAEWIQRRYRAKVSVIPNSLRGLASRNESREPLVLAVGRLTRQKGFDVLLDAFALLHDEFPHWQVAVLGVGPEYATLQSQIHRLGLDGRVTLAGIHADIESWLARAGIVVQPSRFEGFPNVVLEAMGMGAAVISSDCPAGPSEIIEDNVDGRLVPVGDVAALAAAMRTLMQDPMARARLGDAARSVRERFHPDRIMAQWDQALFPSAPSEVVNG
ncbi:MAG: glycosyltransferase family 4 protein [Pseudomonadota bacterium]